MPYRLITITEGFNLHAHSKKNLKSSLQHSPYGASEKLKYTRTFQYHSKLLQFPYLRLFLLNAVL
jgi:hypothetical protein